MPIDDAPEILDRTTDPAEVFFVNEAYFEREKQIADAMQSISASDREVVTLFYMSEQSVERIGAFLQISPAAVKKRLQRARERLKERMLKMVEESLAEMAPSKNTRFAEASALLRRAHQILESDDRVVAAWLADSFGMPGDSGWTSAWLQVVVKDEHIDAFIRDRRKNAALLGNPLLVVEGPQNAPAGGAYLMAIYDGETGPYEINWYWQAAAGAIIPEKTTIPSGEERYVNHVLFDRAGLPQPEGYVLACEYNREIPPALKAELDSRTEEQIRRDDAVNCGNLFWAMLLISARDVARDSSLAQPPYLDFIQSLLGSVQRFAGMPEELTPSQAPSDTASRVDPLRKLTSAMAAAMPVAAKLGGDINPAIVDRASRFLDMVERG